MTLSLLNKLQEEVEVLENEFKDFNISVVEVETLHNAIVTFVLFPDEKSLKDNWEKITSSIAACIQGQTDDVFIKWNIYLLLLCETNVSKEIKYEIENDKFCCRKIVEENFSKEDLSDSGKKILISSKVTMEDIGIKNASSISSSNYTGQTPLWEIIKNSQIASSKSKDINNSQMILNQILQNYEDKES
jgi:hypothetical protein